VLEDLTDYVVPSIPFKRLRPHFTRSKRGYSEAALVRFKSGATRRVVRQRGGPVRHVELAAALCAAALEIRERTIGRDEWREWLRGRRPNPDPKDRPVFDRCSIELCTLPDLDEEQEAVVAA
jgi:hypothetical protein